MACTKLPRLSQGLLSGMPVSGIAKLCMWSAVRREVSGPDAAFYWIFDREAEPQHVNRMECAGISVCRRVAPASTGGGLHSMTPDILSYGRCLRLSREVSGVGRSPAGCRVS